MKMKAIHNCRDEHDNDSIRCVKLVKDNENESNSQHIGNRTLIRSSCVKLVKDNENESNSQRVGCGFTAQGVV